MPPKRSSRTASSKQLKNIDEQSMHKLIKKKEIPPTDESEDESYRKYLEKSIEDTNTGES